MRVSGNGHERFRVLFIWVSFMFMFGAAQSQAAIFQVPSQYSTIQAAIDQATNGDTVLVASGTYTGDGNTFASFGGKLLTVMSENGAQETVIDCESSAPAFVFFNEETKRAIVHGFTIRNGMADG